jgi:hypothetical protein
MQSECLLNVGVPHELVEGSGSLRDAILQQFGSSGDLMRALNDVESNTNTHTLTEVAIAIDDCRILLLDEMELTLQAFGAPLRRARKMLVLSYDGASYARVRMPRSAVALLMRCIGDRKQDISSWKFAVCVAIFVVGGVLGGC